MNTIKRNPYIGAQSFQESDRERFFGRDQEANELLALALSEQEIVFYAQSGAGKSSLVNTCLIPDLKKKGFEVLLGRVGGDAPSGLETDNIFAFNLLRSLSTRDADINSLANQTLSGFLVPEADSESDSAGRASPRRALIIDQFEEIFSRHHEAWEKRGEFFEQLAQVLEDDPRLRVILVMREDYIAALDPFANLLPSRLRMRYFMQRLEYPAALKAVTEPVKRKEYSRPYDSGTAEKLVDDLRTIKVIKPDGTSDVGVGQFVEPLYLQVICYELWNKLPEGGTTITRQNVLDVGDVSTALMNLYATSVERVANTEDVSEAKIRKWFTDKLISPAGIRNMVLQEAGETSANLENKVIRALSDLVRAEQRGGAVFYELTHDRLAQPIITSNRIWFEEHLSTLQKQAALWDAEGKKDTWLSSDQALVEMEKWGKAHSDELTETEKEFLEACRKLQAQIEERQAAERKQLEIANKLAAEQARSAKRARIFNIVSGALVVIAIIAVIIGYSYYADAITAKEEAITAKTEADSSNQIALLAKQDAQKQAIKALAGDLNSRADEINDQQPDLAILLKMQAYPLNNNVRTQKSLLLTLQEYAGLRGFIQQSADQILFSPDGKTMATLENGGVTLWDINNRTQLNPEPIRPEHFNPVYPVAFNKDGNLLASASQDGTVVIWDAATGKQLTDPLNEHNIWIDGMAFSPTKNILATCADDTNVILWDVSDPQRTHKISVLKGHTNWVANVVFSSDGNMVASTASGGETILWNIKDPENPKKISRFVSGATSYLYSVSFGQNDEILGIANGSYLVLWNITNPQEPKEITSQLDTDYTYINNLTFLADGETVVAISFNTIFFLDVKDPQNPERIGEEPITEFADEPLNSLSTLAFNSETKTLAIGGCDGTCKIYLWDISKLDAPEELGAPLRTRSSILSLAFSPDGATLASGMQDGSVLRWDLTNKDAPESIAPPLKGHKGQSANIGFNQDGSLLTSYGVYGDVSLIEVGSRKLIGAGNILSYTDPEEKVFLYQYYDRKTGNEFNQIVETNTGEKIGAPVPGTFLEISPSKNFIVHQTINEKGVANINLWSVKENKPIRTGIKGNFIRFSTDEQYFATQELEKNRDTWIRLIETDTGTVISPRFKGELKAFSPDSPIVYYQTDSEAGSVLNAWDIRKKTRLLEVPGTYIAASQDGKYLAYLDQENAQASALVIIDTSTAQQIGEPIAGIWLDRINHGAETLIYSYTDTNSKPMLGILDTETKEIISLQEGNIIAASPDNQKLIYQTAEKSKDYAIHVFDLITRKSTAPYPHSLLGIVNSVFSPDNAILAYQTEDPYALGFINLDTGSVTDTSIVGVNWQSTGKGDYSVSNVIFGPENKTLAYYDTIANSISLLDLASGDPIGDTPIVGSILGVDPDHKTLVYQYPSVENTSASIGLLDLSSGIISQKTDGSFLGFTADSTEVIYASTDNLVIGLLDASTGKPVGSIKLRGNYLGYIPKSDLFASRDNNGMIYLWDPPHPWILGDLTQPQPAAPIQNATLSPDGKSLALTNEDSLFIQPLAKSGSEPIKFPNRHAGGVINVEFNPTNDTFFTVGADSRLILWEWDQNNKPAAINSVDGTSGLFTPDGTVIIVADEATNKTRFIDATSFKITGSQIGGSQMRISPDQNTLAVLDYQKQKITLWNLTTLKQIGGPIAGTDLNFNKTGTFIWVSDQNKNTLTLIDLRPSEPRGEPLSNESSPLFSPDGEVLFTVKNPDPNTCAPILRSRKLTSQVPTPKDSDEFECGVYPASFSPTGKFLFIPNYNNGTLRLKNLDTNSIVNIPGNPIFSPDEKFLAVEQSGKTNLWKVDNFNQDPEELNGVGMQFSPQGRYMLTHDENMFYVWDLQQAMKNMTSVKIPITSFENAFFSPNDTYLVISVRDKDKDKDETSLFDLKGASPQTAIQTIPGVVPQFDPNNVFLVTSKSILRLDTKQITETDNTESFVLKENEKVIAIFSGKGITVWDLQDSSKPGQVLSGHTASITQLVFNPQQNLLATLASDGVILIGLSDSSNDGQTYETIPGTSISFSPDGNIMAIGSEIRASDGNVVRQTVLWNISNLESIQPIENGEIQGAQQGIFSPDNKYLVTTDVVDKTTSVWDLEAKGFETPVLKIAGTYPRFSKDGDLLVVFNFGTIGQNNAIGSTSLWDMTRINEGTSSNIGEFTLKFPCDINTPESYPYCMPVSFNPDGKIMAFTDGAFVKLWNVKEKKEFGKIEVPNGVNHLSFVLKEKNILVVGSNDGTFTLWNVSSTSKVKISDPIPGTFVGETAGNILLYLSNNTRELVTWEFTPEQWLNQLCAKVDYSRIRNDLDKAMGDATSYLTKQDKVACPLWEPQAEAPSTASP